MNNNQNTPLFITDHARLRMAQRNLTEANLTFVLNHGARYHVAKSLHVYLRQRDIPSEHRNNSAVTRLEGLAVILDQESSTIITLWRNRQSGLKQIKNKPNFGW
jgi:hypothetical protein